MLPPKEPENEAGRQARQQFLVQARKVIGEAEVDYNCLYQRFAENAWAAIKLDEAIARTALIAGYAPKHVVGLLHQSPYLQHQVHIHQVPLAPMSQYVRSTVMKVMKQLEKKQLFEQRSQGRFRQYKSGLGLE